MNFSGIVLMISFAAFQPATCCNDDRLIPIKHYFVCHEVLGVNSITPATSSSPFIHLPNLNEEGYDVAKHVPTQ
jgi:hypothetical protein